MQGQIGAVPRAEEVGVATILRVDSKIHLGIQKTNGQLAAVGVEIGVVNVAAHIEPLRHALGGTEPGIAEKAVRWALSVESKMRPASELRRDVDEHRVFVAGVGPQLAVTPPAHRRPTSADVKRPGSQSNTHQNQNYEAKHKAGQTAKPTE